LVLLWSLAVGAWSFEILLAGTSAQKHAGRAKIMSDTPNEPAPPVSMKKILRRLLTTLLAVAFVGWLARQATTAIEGSASPAGFGRGVLQGALMPAALPNLLVGHDVTIYAQNNTGVNYKLGYTMGVNACGAIFFGIFFWRLSRLRKALTGVPKKAD
jgi:hypothetical protein